MSEYSEYFLNSSGGVAEVECLEFQHPNFTATYRIVRNYSNGCTVKHEDGNNYIYAYYPLAITLGENRADLDQKINITFGDLGEVIPKEIDAVILANGMTKKPTLTYRTYRSDDLETILFGPVVYEISNISLAPEGATFEAAAPSLNISKTGELYSLVRFPMLRGFL